MRQQMIEEDVVECVIGLGPNLFYNSPMEACLLITNSNKPKKRRGKTLIINAIKEVRQGKNIAFLDEEHIQKIFGAYRKFADHDGLARLVETPEILEHNASLNVSLYMTNVGTNGDSVTLQEAVQNWSDSSTALESSMKKLFATLG